MIEANDIVDTSAKTPPSRRDFLKTTAALSATAVVVGGCASTLRSGRGPFIHPPGGNPDKLRVGLIGCGGRGTGAAKNCVESSPNIEIVALGDLFQDRIDEAREHLGEKLGGSFVVPKEQEFAGFDNFTNVLACDLDMVILATPPHFRAQHLRAAIEAGKHVFMEKPVAVDPVGCRSVIESAALAESKGLAIVAGTQRRHQHSYVETMNRIHDGAIGELVGGQCYWNMGTLWVDRAAKNWEKHHSGEWSDMEWQVRNWLFCTWLSGDHIVEQHVHNIDVINWAMGSPPVKAVGMGGRQVRTDAKYGNIFDHFSIEFEYPGGVRVASMCRQMKGAMSRVSERLVGTKGAANPNGLIEGRRTWKYETEAEPVNPYVQEHADLIAGIRRGTPLNEGKRIAESTLTAILGRMSAYTGREISWKWIRNASKLDLTPPAYEFGDLPMDPVAVPGETQLV